MPRLAPNQPMSTNLTPVIRHIHERIEHPAARDGRRIGLVVQGGAMRGVFTAGALCGLESIGAREVFDRVYGSSGGAVNAAYYLAGQAALGTSIYYEDINNREFIDFKRFLRGTALDIGFCYDEVVARRKRLELDRVRDSRSLFKIYVTSTDPVAVRAFLQRDAGSARDLLTLLKASAAMPFVYRRPIHYRGQRLVDGATFAPVPLFDAIADGCTDILVLMSRPLAEAATVPQGWLMPLVVGSINWHARRASKELWKASQQSLAGVLDLLREAEAHPETTLGGFHVAVVSPPDEFRVSRWTTDRALLIDAAAEGARRVLEALGVPGEEIDPRSTLLVPQPAVDRRRPPVVTGAPGS